MSRPVTPVDFSDAEKSALQLIERVDGVQGHFVRYNFVEALANAPLAPVTLVISITVLGSVGFLAMMNLSGGKPWVSAVLVGLALVGGMGIQWLVHWLREAVFFDLQSPSANLPFEWSPSAIIVGGVRIPRGELVFARVSERLGVGRYLILQLFVRDGSEHRWKIAVEMKSGLEKLLLLVDEECRENRKQVAPAALTRQRPRRGKD